MPATSRAGMRQRITEIVTQHPGITTAALLQKMGARCQASRLAQHTSYLVSRHELRAVRDGETLRYWPGGV